jgi:hypothetical protein
LRVGLVSKEFKFPLILGLISRIQVLDKAGV